MKNNCFQNPLLGYAAIQAIYNLNFSKNLNDIKKNLIENKVFFIDSNLEINFKKTNISKSF